MKVSTPRWIGLCLLVSASLSLNALAVRAEDRRADDNDGLSVTVAFGSGLNTVGAANNHVLPPEIKVRQDGVVHFLVSGFHMVVVYKPGTEPEDIISGSGTYPRPDKNSTERSLLLRDQSARWASRHASDHQSPQWFQSARGGLFLGTGDLSGDLQAAFP
jgi:hypothetical protein